MDSFNQIKQNLIKINEKIKNSTCSLQVQKSHLKYLLSLKITPIWINRKLKYKYNGVNSSNIDTVLNMLKIKEIQNEIREENKKRIN